MLGNYAQATLQMTIPGLAEARESSPPYIGIHCATLLLCQLLVTGLVVCVLTGVNQVFVAFWLRDPNLFGGPLLNALLLLALLLWHLYVAQIVSLFALGYNRYIPLMNTVNGALTLGATFAFVKWVGPAATPAGPVVVLAGVGVPLNLWAMARTTATPPWQLLGRLAPWAARLPIPATAAAALAALAAPESMTPAEQLAYLAGSSLAIAGLYVGVMWPVIQQTPIGSRLVPAFTRGLVRLLRLSAQPPES
jgi:hypothetical protein